MANTTLKPIAFDHHLVKLTPEEGYVLSRIDQPVLARDVPALTGLPAERAQAIVMRLIQVGALVADTSGQPVRRTLTGMPAFTPPSPTAGHSPPSTERPQPSHGRNRTLTPHTRTPAARPEYAAPTRAEVRSASSSAQQPAAPVEQPAAPVEQPAAPVEQPAQGFTESEPHGHPRQGNGRSPSGFRARASTPLPATGGSQLFDERFKHLSPTERANRAQRAEGDDLVALCHDQHPQVVLALMANAAFTTRHARLVALYHQHPTGLELLARNTELLSDPKVQLCLLLNPGLTETVLKRMFRASNMSDLSRLAVDARVPNQARPLLTSELRDRFSKADGKEQADLVYWSDGRVLESLGECTWSEEATALLCKRTFTSPGLVRRLAAHRHTPTALLEVLARQPIVAEHPDLQTLIVSHANTPRRAGRGR